jgi:hypothetical protein
MGIKTEAIVSQPPPFPEPLRYLWEWFCEILQGIDGNGWSQPVVSWMAIDSWSRMTRQEVAPRDARTIVRMGVMRANILAEKPKANGSQS